MCNFLIVMSMNRRVLILTMVLLVSLGFSANIDAYIDNTTDSFKINYACDTGITCNITLDTPSGTAIIQSGVTGSGQASLSLINKEININGTYYNFAQLPEGNYVFKLVDYSNGTVYASETWQQNETTGTPYYNIFFIPYVYRFNKDITNFNYTNDTIYAKYYLGYGDHDFAKIIVLYNSTPYTIQTDYNGFPTVAKTDETTSNEITFSLIGYAYNSTANVFAVAYSNNRLTEPYNLTVKKSQIPNITKIEYVNDTFFNITFYLDPTEYNNTYTEYIYVTQYVYYRVNDSLADFSYKVFNYYTNINGGTYNLQMQGVNISNYNSEDYYMAYRVITKSYFGGYQGATKVDGNDPFSPIEYRYLIGAMFSDNVAQYGETYTLVGSGGSTTTETTVTNIAPTVVDIVVNNDLNVTPACGTTVSVPIKVYVNDSNGYQDVSSVVCDIWNGTLSFNNTSFSFESGSGNQAVFSYSWSVPSNYEAGTWNIKCTATDSAGATDTRQEVFYIEQLACIELKNIPVIFNAGQPGTTQTAKVGYGFPMTIDNLGNTAVDIFIKGTDLTGVTDSSWSIPVTSIEYDDVDTFTSPTQLTSTFASLTTIPYGGSYSTYFRINLPAPLKAQTYKGTLTISAG